MKVKICLEAELGDEFLEKFTDAFCNSDIDTIFKRNMLRALHDIFNLPDSTPSKILEFRVIEVENIENVTFKLSSPYR